MDDTIKNVITNPRRVSGDYHVATGSKWRKYGKGQLLQTPLVYSASDDDIPRIQRFRNLIRVLHEDAGNRRALYRALIFNRIFAKIFVSPGLHLSIPDIGKLSKYWGDLSDLCHRQLKPEESWNSLDWIANGYAFVKEAEDYLVDISVTQAFGWCDKNSLGADLASERESFVLGNNDEKSLETRMILMKPVIEMKSGHSITLLTGRQ